MTYYGASDRQLIRRAVIRMANTALDELYAEEIEGMYGEHLRFILAALTSVTSDVHSDSAASVGFGTIMLERLNEIRDEFAKVLTVSGVPREEVREAVVELSEPELSRLRSEELALLRIRDYVTPRLAEINQRIVLSGESKYRREQAEGKVPE